MENNIDEKRILLDFIDWSKVILDVGSSSGALTFELAMNSKHTVFALEPDKETFEVLSENVSTFDNVKPVNQTMQQFLSEYKEPCNIVLSSIMHHILMHRFQIKSLKPFFAGLPKGSRVIIRDGVRPGEGRANQFISLICNPESLKLAKIFLKDWVGNFKQYYTAAELEYSINGCAIRAQRWLITELMLTITWGMASMERECKEHFTVMGQNDYIKAFESVGYETLYAESIIQKGYQEFLPKLGKLVNDFGYEIPLPFTTQILCFRKS